MKSVSLVIPVYRNAKTLRLLYNDVFQVLKNNLEIQFEFMFVNDGSDDDSLKIIQELSINDSRIRHISFEQNRGQVAAIVEGLSSCSGEAAIIMSADLQDPIEMIQNMLNFWESGSSIVICYRVSREDRWIDRVLSSVFYWLVKFKYKDIPRGGFDYFLLDCNAIKEFNQINNKRRFLQGDVIKLQGEKTFLPYKRLSRKAGTSQWTFQKKFKYALDALLFNS